tara:strand:+ start:266 stop:406 length:141 start_codon:yes stop_codon:yes gene_type:complete
MKTTYPEEPIKDYNEWRRWLSQQVLDADERRVIEQFKQSIINASTK